MVGPCNNGTKYYAFMKAKGQSRKDSETASGSYGIGKFAPMHRRILELYLFLPYMKIKQVD